MKYNTGNPVGSSDPRDLFDNAGVADNLLTGNKSAYPDRKGVPRKSWRGLESEFAAFIAASGYEFIGDYVAGIEIAGYQQVVRDDYGEFWRASGSTSLPYTTTGEGMPEGGAFVSVGDASIRQQLKSSDPDKGASLISMPNGETLHDAVNGRVIRVAAVADIEALAPASKYQVSLSGEKAAFYEWVSGDYTGQIDGEERIAWNGDASPGATGAWIRFDHVTKKQYAAQYLQTTSDILNNVPVELMRFIPVDLHAAIKEFTSTADHAPYMQDANDALTTIGGTILLPRGRLGLSATVNGTNRVNFKGQGRCSQIYANPDIANDTMFYFANDTSSMFSSRLDDCWLRVEGIAAVKQAIISDAWQENCGAKGLVISGLDGSDKRGILLRYGYGGAAYLKLQDLEIFGAGMAAGIDVEEISSVGGFILHVDGATITGATGSPAVSCIRMMNDTLFCSGFHTEYATNGIRLEGGSRGHILSSTGSANEVENLVSLASSWTGDLRADLLVPNGATTTIKDNRSGDDRTGVVSGFSYSAMHSPSNAKAWVVFDGITGNIKSSQGVSSVVRNDVGNYTITWERAFADLDYMVSPSHNATAQRIALCRDASKVASSYQLLTQEWNGSAGSDAQYVDPTDVRVVAYAERDG